jgi:Domain of unknown function (DUF4271)
MRHKLIFLFICMTWLSMQHTFAGSIVGLNEAVTDTSMISLSNRFDKVLRVHPLLVEQITNQAPIVKIRPSSNKTAVFLLAVLLLFFFSMVRIIFPRYFVNLFQVFTGISISKRHIKDQLENDNRASVWFYSIFFISVGFIVYQLITEISGTHFSNVWYINYLISTLFVFILLGFRISMIRLTGWIFKRSDYVHIYLFNTKLVNEFLGLLLFPLCILILVTSGNIQYTLLMTASALCLLFFAYGYVRNIPVLRNLFRISFVHFLLYICAFEIIPVLILIKMIRYD